MKSKNLETRVVVCQEWLESERGWGQRPDGASLHISNKDCEEYIQEYWDTMPKEVPDEYSRPCGKAYVLDVPVATYEMVTNSENGIRIWSGELYNLKK